MTQTASCKAGKWVLVPGTLCAERVFDPLLEQLEVEKSACQFIAADAPDVRDYEDRLRQAVAGGEIVCGFSLGALILAHNLQALKSARAVVLLASNPFSDPPGNRASREQVRDKVLAGGVRDWVSENWAAMSASKSEDLKDFVAEMGEETMGHIAAQTELAASRPGAHSDLVKTHLPLIFVTGSEDQLTPSSLLATIVENAKAAHLNVLEGLGHFALIEAPDRVAKAIRDGFETVGLSSNREAPSNETREHSSITS